MKFIAAVVLALPLAAAFVPWPFSQTACGSSSTCLESAPIKTGFGGKAAASFDEDLMLTLRIIMDHQERSTTVSKEQFIAQVKEAKNMPEPTEPIDVSVPYDAAAKLAYEESDKSILYFADFKAKYEEEAVALVKSKRSKREVKPKAPVPESKPKAESKPEPAPVVVDLSIPYDAAAKLAYEASDKKATYAEFKAKYEADAVALVKSKRSKVESKPKAESSPKAESKPQPAPVAVDLSIPYDAAAKLAYEASDKSAVYTDFKAKYEADAVALVKSKQPINISIPYDAAARLAFAASDRTTPYADFKLQFEAQAVADVIAKRKQN